MCSGKSEHTRLMLTVYWLVVSVLIWFDMNLRNNPMSLSVRQVCDQELLQRSSRGPVGLRYHKVNQPVTGYCFRSPLCQVSFIIIVIATLCVLQSRDVQRSDHVAEWCQDAGKPEHCHHLVWKQEGPGCWQRGHVPGGLTLRSGERYRQDENSLRFTWDSLVPAQKASCRNSGIYLSTYEGRSSWL